MAVLKSIKIERNLARNLQKFIKWSDEGDIVVSIPSTFGREVHKNDSEDKDDYSLTLCCLTSHWLVKVVCKKITIISIKISEVCISEKNEIIAAISKVKVKNEIHIEAPFITLTGFSNTGTTLHLVAESYIYTNATITCNELFLTASKDIRIFSETIIVCKKFSLTCINGECFHHGAICCLEQDKVLELNIDAELFHIIMEGRIGMRHKSSNISDKNCPEFIRGTINATLCNFGKIKAKSEVVLSVKEIPSLKNSQYDTAQRLLLEPSLWNLSTPKYENSGKRIRGFIESETIDLHIEKSIEDIAQLHGKYVILTAGENCVSEELSKCTAYSFAVKSSKTVDIKGNLSFGKFIVNAIHSIYLSGNISASVLSIVAKNFSHIHKLPSIIIQGTVNTQNFMCDTSGSVEFNPRSKFETRDADVTSNSFLNNSNLVFQHDFRLKSNNFGQNTNAKIIVGNWFQCHSSSAKEWKGTTKASFLQIIPKQEVIVSGYVMCDITEIVVDHEMSKFNLEGDMDVKETFFVKKSFDSPKNSKKIYNITINGNLTTEQILARNSALHLKCQGTVKINASSKTMECQIYADQIISDKGSLIVLPTADVDQNIICNTIWVCEGDVIQGDNLMTAKAICDTQKLHLCGSLLAANFIAIASLEQNMELFAKIRARQIELFAVDNEIFLDETSMLDCNRLFVVGDQANTNGEICNSLFNSCLKLGYYVKKFLNNGKIGLKNGQCVTSNIVMHVNGDFTNHGILQSNYLTDIKAQSFISNDGNNDNPATDVVKKIYSSNLRINCDKFMEDCSQLNAKWMEIYVKDNFCVEKDSVWNSGNVHLEVDGDIVVNGNINFTALNCISSKNIFTSADSNIKTSLATLTANSFEHNGKWDSDNLRCNEIKNITINGKMTLRNVGFFAYNFLMFNESSTITAAISEIRSLHCVLQEGKIANTVFEGLFESEMLSISTNENIDVLQHSLLKINTGYLVAKDLNNSGEIVIQNKLNICSDTIYQSKTGRFCSENQLQIDANIISNNGLLQAQNSLIFSAECLVNYGRILSHGLCTIDAHSEANKFEGSLTCDMFYLNPRKRLALSGEVKCKDCNVRFDNLSTVLIFAGKMSCINAVTALTFCRINLQKNYQFQIRGILSAQSIDGENIGIELKPKSRLFIHDNCENDAIICDKMRLHDESVLVVESSKKYRKIKCKKEWYQQGNVFHDPVLHQSSINETSKIVFNGDIISENVTIKSASSDVDIEIEGNINADQINITTNNCKICILQKSFISSDDINIFGTTLFNLGLIVGKDNLVPFSLNLNVEQAINGNTAVIGSDVTIKIVIKLFGDLINFGKINAQDSIEFHLRNMLSALHNPIQKLDLENLAHGIDGSVKIISANKIIVNAEKSIEDCSQLSANFVEILAGEDVTCETYSKWESGTVNFKCKQNLIVKGQISFKAAKIVAKSVSTSAHASVEISTVDIETMQMELSCLWRCQDFTLKECKDAQVMTLLNKKHYNELPQMLENLHNKFFKINENGKLCCEDAKIFTKVFHSKGVINVHRNLEIFAFVLQQENTGQITGDTKLNIVVNTAPEFKGSLMSKHLTLTVLKNFLCFALLNADKADILLLDPEFSTFLINNQMVVNGPLTLLSLKQEEQENCNVLERNLINGFKINAVVTVETLKSAAFIQMEETAKLILMNQNASRRIKTTLLDISSIYVKQNATVTAKNYAHMPVEICVGGMIMFDDTLLQTHDIDEIDCLPYIERSDTNVFIETNIDYIGFSKFLTYFGEVQLGPFGTEVSSDL